MGIAGKFGKAWWIDYRLDGKRYRERIGASKERAELALADIEVRKAKDQAGLPIEYPIQSWVNQFLEYIQAYLKPSTVTRYKEALRWFFEFIDTWPTEPYYLSDITPEIIESYKTSRLKIRKRKTVNNELSVLRRFFNFAIERGHLHRNPCEKVAMLKVTDRRLPCFLTKEELAQIYAAASSRDRPVLRFLANTGTRWGELRHLEWSDIDMRRRVMHIGPKTTQDGVHFSPKTGQARDAPLNDAAYETLKQQDFRKGYVFTSGRGRILHRNSVRDRLKRTCEELGIENVNLHTFWHTCASHLVMAGVDLSTVGK